MNVRELSKKLLTLDMDAEVYLSFDVDHGLVYPLDSLQANAYVFKEEKNHYIFDDDIPEDEIDDADLVDAVVLWV
jgi:hypothetical protein